MAPLPRVSCVIIFLNAETFFVEAIESVFAQTYRDWELLFLDDGSTDGSTAIAKDYAARFPDRVRYFEHEGHQNRGMSASRNVGIRNARGEYVALLDADDLWLPGKLSAQVAALDARPEAAMVFDSTRMWFSWADEALTPKDRNRSLGVPPDSLVPPPRMFEHFLKTEAETPGTCSVLFRRDVALRVGGFEEAFRGLHEDQAFFYKLVLEHPVYVAPGQTAWYRQHAKSACHVAESDGSYDPANQFNSSSITFLNWLAGHVDTRMNDPRSFARHLEAPLRSYLFLWLSKPGGNAPGAFGRLLVRLGLRRNSAPRTPRGSLIDDYRLYLAEIDRGPVRWVRRKLGHIKRKIRG